MENQNIFKITMHKGLFLGLLFTANFLFSASRNIILLLLTYVVLAAILVVMFRMTKFYRDRECGGFIKFGKVFSFIVLSFFFASIIAGIFKLIYVQSINPGYLETMLEQALIQMEKNQAIFERLGIVLDESYYNQLEKQFRPANFVMQSIWINVFWGVFLAIVYGLILKKKPGIFDETPQEASTEPEKEI